MYNNNNNNNNLKEVSAVSLGTSDFCTINSLPGKA